MKNKKQILGIGLALQAVACGILSIFFWKKRKALSSIFAGASIAGGVGSAVVLLKKGGCKCCQKSSSIEEGDDFDEANLSDEDIFCDFEAETDTKKEKSAE
ncbi:MAG: hypothetical protein RR246_02050 [Clostridia bacterium]